jgi:hypothetical protein
LFRDAIFRLFEEPRNFAPVEPFPRKIHEADLLQFCFPYIAKNRKKPKPNPNDLLGLGEHAVGQTILTKGPRNPQNEFRNEGQKVGLKVRFLPSISPIFLPRNRWYSSIFRFLTLA